MKYNSDVIEFFKNHNMYDKEMFDYLEQHTVMVDYNDSFQRMFIGFTVRIKNGKLIDFTICVPYVEDNVTMLNNIHEITHGIYAYNKIGKKYNSNVSEVLPFLFEKLFVLETNDEELNKYSEYLDSLVDEDSEERYKIAMKCRDVFLREKISDYEQAEKMNQRIERKENLRLKMTKIFKS